MRLINFFGLIRTSAAEPQIIIVSNLFTITSFNPTLIKVELGRKQKKIKPDSP